MNELIFEGRPVSGWLEESKGADKDARRSAVEGLLRMLVAAAEALPAVSEGLKDPGLISAAGTLSCVGEFGESVVAAIPQWRDALQTIVLTATNPAARGAASEALVAIGPYARSPIPVLLDNLHDDVPAVRWAAAHGLGEVGPEAFDALGPLTHLALYDPVPRVAVEAAVAVWRIDRRIHRVLGPLTNALKDPDEIVRWLAADCLGEIGSEAKSAVPALQDALQMPYKTRLIRMGIATALERIEPGASGEAL